VPSGYSAGIFCDHVTPVIFQSQFRSALALTNAAIGSITTTAADVVTSAVILLRMCVTPFLLFIFVAVWQIQSYTV
jgi:hypothetical protein